MKIEDLEAYEVVEEKRIEELKSDGILLRHKKTGARVALLSNEDENKVFSISFRTTPKNSTGVAHIIEHTVLCGSKNFPVKDPFIELAKGSLNTFLNAITFPDKTMYPVASCNDRDFQNLMHVYLDAVFYPAIYGEEKIFKQEGWHYELEDEEDALKINGVVYNEMKGAFSSPEDVLNREILSSLYPDTTYGYESGGDPDVIPELTYEEFLDFHRKYYHPSNSYIYLYGDMDMAEKLDFIDREYLSRFDGAPVDSAIGLQEAFAQCRRVEKEYPIGNGEDEAGNAYFSYNFSVGDTLDKEKYIAFQVLDYALCTAPGAPLKQALIDRGIGTEVYSMYDSGVRQPVFMIVSKNADHAQESAFVRTVEEVLEDIAEKGFDKKALLAGLNHYEFKHREADYGSYPKGLMYGLQMMESWLYADESPFLHLEANETFAVLKEKLYKGYFEGLLREYFLGNRHRSLVILVPKKGLTEQRDRELTRRLKERRDAMSDEEIKKAVEDTRALRAYQEEPDSEEALAKIPLLSVADLKKEATHFVNDLRKLGENDFLFHELFTNGIAYLRLIFKLDHVPAELYPYVGIMKGMLGGLNTEHYSYADLNNEINIHTGGISVANNVYVDISDGESFTATMEVKCKVLQPQIGKAVELMRELLLTSDFTDKKRLKEILAEGRSQMQEQMTSAAHSVAVGRAMAGVSRVGVVNEVLWGISFYRLVERLDDRFPEESDDLIKKLERLARILFRPENLLVDLTGSEEMAKEIAGPVGELIGKLYTCEVKGGVFDPKPEKRKEGYRTAGQVQYVCRAGNFRRKGIPYTGTLKVLKVMLGYDYLWNQVRVRGGAYGCMCGFEKSGVGYFVSYRDPNLKNTLEVYEAAADYIASYEADERALTQFIIGAVSELDTPMTPAAKGLYSLVGFMTGQTDEDLQKERDELLHTTAGDLRRTARQIRAFMEDESLCVVGNAEKIEEVRALFDHVEDLVNG